MAINHNAGAARCHHVRAARGDALFICCNWDGDDGKAKKREEAAAAAALRQPALDLVAGRKAPAGHGRDPAGMFARQIEKEGL